MENNFGSNIEFLRKKINKTQTDIALQVNKTQKIVSNWEHKKTEPTIGEIRILSKYFGVSVDNLLFSDLTKGNLNSKEAVQKNTEKGKVKGKVMGKLNSKTLKEYEIEDREISRVADDPAPEGSINQSQKIEQLYEAQIAALNNTIIDKNTIIAQLSEQLKHYQEQLKTNISELPIPCQTCSLVK